MTTQSMLVTVGYQAPQRESARVGDWRWSIGFSRMQISRLNVRTEEMSSRQKYQRAYQRSERTRPQAVKIEVPMIYGGRRGSDKFDFRRPPSCRRPMPDSAY